VPRLLPWCSPMIHPGSSSIVAVVALVFLGGCGGGVTTGSGGSGATTGTGGGAASGSGGAPTTGSGGGQPAGCPAAEPTPDTPCNLDPGETCSYGDSCCPPVYGCIDGMWSPFDVACAAPAACPLDPPPAGSACGDQCLQWSPCGYPCNQATSVLAECANGAWQATSSACSDVVMCGDATCAPGEICLATAGGPGISYACTTNPCPPGPLSCECAGSLCGGEMYECHVDSGDQVSCACSMCP
jgi:hypothetical protein